MVCLRETKTPGLPGRGPGGSLHQSALRIQPKRAVSIRARWQRICKSFGINIRNSDLWLRGVFLAAPLGGHSPSLQDDGGRVSFFLANVKSRQAAHREFKKSA